jgi:rhodanese-related sulfurtransferase
MILATVQDVPRSVQRAKISPPEEVIMGFLDSVFGPQVPAVDVVFLKAAKEAGKVPVLVDVRTPEEYQGGHVPGAVLMPLADFAQTVDQLAPYKGQEIYVICRSGARSARACGILAERGYKGVNIDGGTMAWVAQGWPVE